MKTSVITETLKIIEKEPIFKSSKAAKTQADCPEEEDKQQGLFKKILPSNNAVYEELYIYSRAEEIFKRLAGARSLDNISQIQFQRLSKLPRMTNQNLTKAHYDLVFKNVVRRSENAQMDLNSFFEALEELAQRLYHNKKNTHDNLTDLI